MKKTLLTIITLLLVFILATGMVFAETSGRTVNLVVGQSTAQIDGQNVTMTAPAQVISGRTLVPLRFISEAFGCDVKWDSGTRTATVTLEGQIIEVPIGLSEVIINGEKIAVEVPGQLINGSTFVPLRFIGENLGAKVDYDAATKGISILLNTYKNKDQNFEMVLPVGWTVVEENAEGVELSCGTDLAAQFFFADKGEGINADNFDAFAQECFKEFAAKDGFVSNVESDIAAAAYSEDGLLNMIAFKLTDKGIYSAVIATSPDSFTDTIADQCDLMLNTLKTYAQ